MAMSFVSHYSSRNFKTFRLSSESFQWVLETCAFQKSSSILCDLNTPWIDSVRLAACWCRRLYQRCKKTTSATLVELGHGFLPLLQYFSSITTLSTWNLPSHWSSWGNALDTDNTPVARLHLQNILGTLWILCSGWTVTLCLCSSGRCQQTSHSCSQHDTVPQQFLHQDTLQLGILTMCWHGKGRKWELICFHLGLFNAFSHCDATSTWVICRHVCHVRVYSCPHCALGMKGSCKERKGQLWELGISTQG